MFPSAIAGSLEVRFLGALSVKEAAGAMGTSEANAKVLQHRVLRLAGQSVSADGTASD